MAFGQDMIVLLISDYGADPKWWAESLASKVEGVVLRVWPEIGNPDDIEVIIIDTHMRDKGGFGRFGNLNWVSYLGHGVSDVLLDPTLPSGALVTRMRDADLAKSMTLAAVHAVLAHHTRAEVFRQLQAAARWERIARVPVGAYRIAVLGLGSIGAATAQGFASLGYEVAGWSRGAKQIPGVRCLHGSQAIEHLLPESDAVVALLPETPDTVGFFDRVRLRSMKPGSLLVNLGRGSLIVEEQLIACLDEGQPGHAALDVFRTEPLPSASPLWRHPAVTITPHAGGPYAGSMPIDEIAENFRKLRANETLLNLANPMKGY